MSNFIAKHRRNFNFESFVAAALAEDTGNGDHTSLATIPASQWGKMKLLVKENGVIAGVEAAKQIFKTVDKKISFKQFISDGETVKTGAIVFEVEGKVQVLLQLERLVLNIMQRMSGIATHTNRLQKLCKGTNAKVIDTRKTTPGFRFFEKWAVVIGGGANHRYGLYDMVLIKDNHIDFSGGITNAIDATQVYLKRHKLKLPVEVETRNLSDVQAVVRHGNVQRIMLDNFSVADTKKAVKMINGRFEVESSGGINDKTIAAYAKCGVDFISVGALTHHVKSLDLSLKAV